MVGDFAINAFALAEVGFRVSARMVMGGIDGEESRALMTAPPCFPVAPVIRRILDMVASYVFIAFSRGSIEETKIVEGDGSGTVWFP